MRVILFGASGMVGRGVLRECLLASDVAEVVSVVRAPTGASDSKLREIVHPNLFELSSIETALADADACFFCLGTSSAGMSEDAYRRLTYDLTLSVAQALLRVCPRLSFIYVSGAGTDSSEKRRSMWARVKGKTENDLLGLPLRHAYMFRPGVIRPLHGIVPKTRVYRVVYALLSPIIPLLEWLFPAHVTNTERVGRAMLAAARSDADSGVVESREINALAG